MGDIHHSAMAMSSKSRRLQAIAVSGCLAAMEACQKERMEPCYELKGNTYDSTLDMRFEGDVQAQV